MARMLAVLVVISLLPVRSNAEVVFDWATVGNPGNPDDSHGDGYGGVDYTYRIAKHEVTNGQYAEFLNAVDATGANSLCLYNPDMTRSRGGISNTGTMDGERYIVLPQQRI